jgi:hypothetical protein
MSPALAELQPVYQVGDPWAWAFVNKIRLVGATFDWKGHEFQADPMSIETRTVTVRKATQMAFADGGFDAEKGL